MMNSVIFNGYIQGTTQYLLDSDNIPELRFFVSVDTPTLAGISIIPCKTKGELATRCHVELSKGGYIEVLGEICKPDKMNMYVYVHQVVFQPESSKNQIVMRSTEFLRMYRPDGIFAEIAKFEDKRGKKK